jgi:hypothetical protein
MVAPYDTTMGIYAVLTRYLTSRQIRLVLDDLVNVPGNKSFRDTLVRLQHIHARKVAGEDRVAVSKEGE